MYIEIRHPDDFGDKFRIIKDGWYLRINGEFPLLKVNSPTDNLPRKNFNSRRETIAYLKKLFPKARLKIKVPKEQQPFMAEIWVI